MYHANEFESHDFNVYEKGNRSFVVFPAQYLENSTVCHDMVSLTSAFFFCVRKLKTLSNSVWQKVQIRSQQVLMLVVS